MSGNAWFSSIVLAIVLWVALLTLAGWLMNDPYILSKYFHAG